MMFGEPNKAWFWAVNGAAGVLSSVAALVLAMQIGLSGAGLVGVGVYLIAVLGAPRSQPPSRGLISKGPTANPRRP